MTRSTHRRATRYYRRGFAARIRIRPPGSSGSATCTTHNKKRNSDDARGENGGATNSPVRLGRARGSVRVRSVPHDAVADDCDVGYERVHSRRKGAGAAAPARKSVVRHDRARVRVDTDTGL